MMPGARRGRNSIENTPASLRRAPVWNLQPSTTMFAKSFPGILIDASPLGFERATCAFSVIIEANRADSKFAVHADVRSQGILVHRFRRLY